MKKKRCVCAAMTARLGPGSREGWPCEYHGFMRAGVASPSGCAQQERDGKLVQVGVEDVALFETEDGRCRSVVVMEGGALAEFPHAAHLAVRCSKGDGDGTHLHGGSPDSPLRVKADMSDPGEARE